MKIGNTEFDFLMTRKIQYDYDANLLKMNLLVRRKDSLKDQTVTLDIYDVNKYIEDAFRKAGLLDGKQQSDI